MTAKELTKIVTENSSAIAANTKSIAQLTSNILILHDSIKSLERITAAHSKTIDKLTKEIAAATRQWQAYLNRQPSN